MLNLCLQCVIFKMVLQTFHLFLSAYISCVLFKLHIMSYYMIFIFQTILRYFEYFYRLFFYFYDNFLNLYVTLVYKFKNNNRNIDASVIEFYAFIDREIEISFSAS